MVKFLVRAVTSLVVAALGLLVCSWIVGGFGISLEGFLVAVAVFALAQSLLAPLIRDAVSKHADALLGGIGLISTFVALLIASLFPGGLRVDGVSTWVLATFVVWIVTALGGWLLPMLVERLTSSSAASESD